MRTFGCASRTALRMTATPLDLPTPVEPSTAKCLLSISSMRDARGDRLVVMQRADRRAVLGAGVDEAELLAPDDAGGVADRGIGGDAALESVPAFFVAHDLAHHVDARDRAEAPAASVALDLGDHADEAPRSRQDAHEITDGRALFLAGPRDRYGDARLRAAHAQNDA